MAAVLVSLLLLAVTGVCPRTLVVVNSAVEVSRGRSVFITRVELQINVDPSADCKVEVVMNEPVTQRVGRLSPQVRVEQVGAVWQPFRGVTGALLCALCRCLTAASWRTR